MRSAREDDGKPQAACAVTVFTRYEIEPGRSIRNAAVTKRCLL